MHFQSKFQLKQQISAKDLSRHRGMLETISWAQPVKRLISFGGTLFGRKIEENVNSLKTGNPLHIEVRKKSAAVVMSTKQYEELLAIKSEFENIVKREGKAFLDQSENEFDKLVASMQTTAHADAMDTLFESSSTDLANSFKPGETEKEFKAK
jgi:hypothetical protein